MRYFVEYVLAEGDKGFKAADLNIPVSGRGRLHFEPKPEYNNRRVESFVSEEEAMRFVKSWPKVFALAPDLIEATQQEAIRAMVREEIEPLIVAMEKLEAQISGMSRPAPKRSKKPSEED